MTNVGAYTTRTGKRVRSYQRGGVTRRLRTGVALDHAIKQVARSTWGGGSAFGSSPGSYRSHLAYQAKVAGPEFTRGNKRIVRSQVKSAAIRARYKGSPQDKARFLALNAERRRRGGKKSSPQRRRIANL